MVKKLRTYTKYDRVIVDEGNGSFPAKITYEEGSYYLNYLNGNKPSRKIYSSRVRRVSKKNGVLIIGEDRRKWRKLADLLL